MTTKNYYESLPRCSKCGLKTRRSYKPRKNFFNQHIVYCEPNECEAPEKCHGQVGIGVATLGSDCHYPEGHLKDSIPHSYAQPNWPFSQNCCNKHSKGCP